MVVPDRDGSGFVKLVSDTGTLTASDANSVTLKEGTAKETYATTTVTVDGTVTVHRNGTSSSLGALQVGDHVHVMKDGTTTRVDASTAAWDKQQQAQRPAGPSWPTA
jgi:hypothetical protein